MKLRKYLKTMSASYRKNKKTFVFYVILRILVVLTMIRSLFTGNYQNAMLCLLSLFLFILPSQLSFRKTT